MHITIPAHSIQWHSGDVLQSTGSKSPGREFKTNEELNKFYNRGKKYNIKMLQIDIQNMYWLYKKIYTVIV